MLKKKNKKKDENEKQSPNYLNLTFDYFYFSIIFGIQLKCTKINQNEHQLFK